MPVRILFLDFFPVGGYGAQKHFHAFHLVPLLGIQHQIGGFGLLVGTVDAGEVGYLAGLCLFVELFGVALHAGFKVGLDINLHKAVADDLPCLTAALLKGRDKGDDGDAARVGKELCHLRGAADVFLAVLRAEAQIAVETPAQLVAVKDIGVDAGTDKALSASREMVVLPLPERPVIHTTIP